MNLYRVDRRNGRVMWTLEVPLELTFDDEYLRRAPVDQKDIMSMVDEALGMVRDQILRAIEMAYDHRDDTFEDETEIELVGLSGEGVD